MARCRRGVVAGTIRAVNVRHRSRELRRYRISMACRLADGGYELTVLPPIENLPSGDANEDTRKYIEVLEKHILKCPEQYFWLHRKFKNRPESLPDAYEDLDSLK